MARVRPFDCAPDRLNNAREKKLIGFSVMATLFIAGAMIYQYYHNSSIITTIQKMGKETEQLEETAKEFQKTVKSIKNSITRLNVRLEEVSVVVTTMLDQQMNTQMDLIDYALQAAGAEVISTGETEGFIHENNDFVLLGYPICAGTTNAQIILQPSTNPGDCWAVKGQEASAVIRLAAMIHVESVSLDHIHKSKAPLGDSSSAPYKFSVWGIDSQKSDHRHLFGIFFYNNNGPAVQTFPVKNDGLRPYRIVEFKVHSNHGNPKYTCIYKIRVHGKEPSVVI